MKKIFPYLLIALLVAGHAGRCGRQKVRTEITVDTLVVRDTVRDTIPVPRNVYIVRTDTVLIRSPADTVVREAALPIERREYRTDDYHAVIEGFRPRLLRMEVFPETRYITETRNTVATRRPAFGVGIQAGYGYNGSRAGPYIGIGVQWNLWSF